jgi:glycosyltransferase involved in cell wall biosynthesis
MNEIPGRVTVVVTTRDSGGTLEPLLRSVRDDGYPEAELVVVDNASSDRTVEIASRYASRILDAGPERSAQRNRGAAEATGEFLLILDADMVLGRATIARCVDAARETSAAAVVVPERTVGRGYWARCRALERSCYEGDETVEAARFFRREPFLAFGGYAEDLTGPEDWDLPARMRAAGETIARADGAMIDHVEDGVSLASHLRKKYYYGQSFGLYLARHPRLGSRQVIPIKPALFRNWRHLAARPTITIGILLMKLLEAFAGGAGLVRGLLRGRPGGG